MFDEAILIVLASEGRKVTVQKKPSSWELGLVDADGKDLVTVETTMLAGGLTALHDAGARALYEKRHPVKFRKGMEKFAQKPLNKALYGLEAVP
jgi:hypothetical protein